MVQTTCTSIKVFFWFQTTCLHYLALIPWPLCLVGGTIRRKVSFEWQWSVSTSIFELECSHLEAIGWSLGIARGIFATSLSALN